MRFALRLLAVLTIAATVLPFWKSEAWWVRVLDFPRAQIALVGILVVSAYVGFYRSTSPLETALKVLLIASILIQGWWMLPYTFVYRQQVEAVVPGEESGHRLSILIANVLMTNRESDRLLDLVESYQPDLMLAVETDKRWMEALAPLDDTYPYSVKVPLPNTYGMILLSREELLAPHARYLIEDSIPSIHASIRPWDSVEVRLYSVHPKPPAPQEDTDTIERDAELLLVGREAREISGPVIVMGDLNDVAWSHTTSLFQDISGLLDPRVGRGMYSTYNAKSLLMRWPLDHIFHSEDFRLVRIERLPEWGSDHFPIFVELQYSPKAALEHDPPDADEDEKQEAEEKIDQAHDER